MKVKFTDGEGDYDISRLSKYFTTINNFYQDMKCNKISIPYCKKDFDKIFNYHEMRMDGFNTDLIDYLGSIPITAEDGTCEYTIGLRYETGNNIDCDINVAKEMYEMAIKKNNSDAMIRLAKLIENEGNHDYAFELYEKSANCGNSEGMYMIALKKYNNDVDRQIELLEKAVDKGHEKSVKLLIDAYKRKRTKQ